MINRRGRSNAWEDPDEESEEGDLYDDSLGYGEGDAAEEEDEYEEFLEREFGIRDVSGRGGSRLSSWQYYTVFIVLTAFLLPLVLLLIQALTR